MKKVCAIIFCLFVFAGCTTVNAEKEVNFIKDDKNLFKQETIDSLKPAMQEVMNDGTVIIVHSLTVEEGQEFADLSDKILDETGAEKGVSLLIDVDNKSLFIGTKGIETISIFNDSKLEDIIEGLKPFLVKKEYDKALTYFVEEISTSLKDAEISE